MLVNVNKEAFNPAELLKAVNSPDNQLTDNGLLLEIIETKDLANTWFAGWAAYKKSMENGTLDIGDLMNLISLAFTIPALATNIGAIPGEVHDMNLTELGTLLEVADTYDLGTLKELSKNTFVTLLYAYKSFTKPPVVA